MTSCEQWVSARTRAADRDNAAACPIAGVSRSRSSGGASRRLVSSRISGIPPRANAATALARQLEGLALSHRQPAGHVIVAMDDDTVVATVALSARWDISVVEHRATAGHLEVADARNLGAQHATDTGAELLVFLDVDCIPAPELLDLYERAATSPRHSEGGAHAFHRFHAASNPPVEHLVDIVANAAVFQHRWRW